MATFCVCNYDWYQSGSSVVIEVRLCNQNVDDCLVYFSGSNDFELREHHDSRKILNLRVKNELVFSTPLHGEVVSQGTTVKCARNKIAITLKKTTDEMWSKLSADVCQKAEGKNNEEQLVFVPKQRPDWDKIGKDAETEEFELMDPTTRLFKMMYDNADVDGRRAMMKSMFESNGTTCNMNWDDVSKRRIEPHASAQFDIDDEEGHSTQEQGNGCRHNEPEALDEAIDNVTD